MSYSVGQRMHEIGIRVALGAERRQVLRAVVGGGLRLAAWGIGVGLLGALAVGRMISTLSADRLLYGVRPTDPMTLAVVCLTMTAVGMLASYVPARRAGRVDPMAALRYE
jgi:putative ABC transport system permease protein